MSNASREAQLSAAFVKLADTLTADFDVVDLLHTLVEECATILDTEAGGIMLLDPAGDLHLVASTSEEASLVEIMQLTAGAGPCVDAFASGTTVTVGDIEASGSRWPAFRDEALKHGFKSVHSTPLRLRGRVLGAMNLFSTRVGELNPADIVVAQALADVASIGILHERSTREKEVVSEQLRYALDTRILVEQAKGVLFESTPMTMDESFGSLRTYAREHRVTLRIVASGVIDRSIGVDDLVGAGVPK
ncbi:GAF and ANTAR domain-containing protein [Marisediminicola antarctica]|uniref:Transcriptional regulator n=1 Tax=Marisediminicola antarctica TaxID=674079 RepID=A0A7L5APH5_9MICO|nr:GAF and ANTAR domain-containing protein [Marisediminicola antarctica]QHO70249.1 transcriptional regulator [Marisediminicola antarctica]